MNTRAHLSLLLFAFTGTACKDTASLARRLSSFEVRICKSGIAECDNTTGRGSPAHRCLLANTPTTGVDLSGCPDYIKDASGTTIIRLDFEASAIDDEGKLLDNYNALATVKMVPGSVDPAYQQVRFTNGVTGTGSERPSVAFRGSFDDTYIWIVDDSPPTRSEDSPGVGSPCGPELGNVCNPVGLTCVNSTLANGYDPEGLRYCTRGCNSTVPCVAGYYCSTGFSASDDYGADVSGGACLRVQPSYAAGVSQAIYLAQPTITDVRKSDTIIGTPFDNEFVDVKQGFMVVTAIRIDGFYVTDIKGTEFNHLYVYNYSRPDDLFAGDHLNEVSGPISDFNGFTELNFPLWDVDLIGGPQKIPDPIDLHGKALDRYPFLVNQGGQCHNNTVPTSSISLLDCNYALKRLEAARVSINVAGTIAIMPGSKEDTNLTKYGQWPVNVQTGLQVLQMQLITRDNIPFFDPKKLADGTPLGKVSGNLRVVAFDEMSEPTWIVEPRDQDDCPACVNH
jgi:hypothetical protein